ncbi:MAG: MBL fold metallo-hydrolase [Caldithrix sp.]|nr:MBL fold metallo-hydrolase [Caldithrix sp.]
MNTSIHTKTHHMGNGLYLVDLDQELTGFRQFISSWIYQRDGANYVVDPGPSSTIHLLVEALQKLDIHQVHYILLTHIHLDHAGGTGHLLQAFPQARVICHPKGIPHLIDPTKLWRGSLNVLGKIAKTYGRLKPVPAPAIGYKELLEGQRIDVVETPGHASHHVSYVMDGILFAGEVAGVSINGEQNDHLLRIATPPKFIYEIYEASLQKASRIEAEKMCFGHYGMRTDVKDVFARAKDQLQLWMDIVRKHYARGSDRPEQAIYNDILQHDPALSSFHQLPPDIRQREHYFCLNSIKGMYEYVKEKDKTASFSPA